MEMEIVVKSQNGVVGDLVNDPHSCGAVMIVEYSNKVLSHHTCTSLHYTT